MDYSAYYLKNVYKDKRQSVPKRYPNPQYRTYRDERDGKTQEPQIIYLQPTAEMMQTSRTPSYDYEAVEVNPTYRNFDVTPRRVKSKKSRRPMGVVRRTTIAFLVVCIAVLTTVVVSDWITQGQLVHRLTVWAQEAGSQYTYYVLVTGRFNDRAAAKAYATTQRLQGGSGFILPSSDEYWVIAEAYETEADAQTVAKKQPDAQVVALHQSKINYKRFESKYRGTLEGYMDYNYTICAQMYRIAAQLESGEVPQNKALDEIYLLKMQADREVEQFRPFAAQLDQQDADRIVSDMQSASGMLGAILSDTSNVLADLRYYRIQMLYNYAALCEKLAE